MARSPRSAAPTRDENGSWSFIVDLGPGPDLRAGHEGEWRQRRQARRRGFPTKRAAQEAMEELRVSSRLGGYVPPERLTVREFMAEIRLPSQRSHLAELTYASYERNLRLHVVPNIGGVTLQALDGSQLNRLYARLLESGRKRGGPTPGLSPRTVRYIHTILHAALDEAVKLRRVATNAADQATPPSARKARAPEMKTWTAEELAAFLDGTHGDRYGYVWRFLAMTGCRRGEALGLRWSDLDLRSEPATASIRQQVLPMQRPTGRGREARIVPSTKGGDARVIELDVGTAKLLKSWRRSQGEERLLLGPGYHDLELVFPRPDGEPFHPDVLTKTFDRRLRLARFAHLPVIRMHDLRHTWATLALEAGVDVAVVSKQLGHSSPVVTWNTYQHVRKGMQHNAAERVAATIFREHG
jgi:integrase